MDLGAGGNVRAQNSGRGRIAVMASEMDGHHRTIATAEVADDAPLRSTGSSTAGRCGWRCPPGRRR